jgi:flagellar assembly protein FliH
MPTGEAPRALCAPGRRRIPAVCWDAAVEAKRRLDEASAEAEALLARAGAEAAEIRAAAAARGHEEGLAMAAETLARAAVERDRLLAASEPQLVDLAFAIASRVVAGVAERHRELVVEVAARALDHARDRADVTLRVHPEDLAALRESESSLLERLPRARRIALVEDGHIGRGGAVVETEGGSIDARLSTQLEGLRGALEAAAS